MLSDMNNAVTPAKAGVYPLNGVDSRSRIKYGTSFAGMTL